ncbi:amidase family protein [Paracoccus sphaerophysae]|uniref:amidase family protein n=1 Tax=Paracoccus sphaerophysae TaxID=690417 RepID=UPI002352125A|nr:amidase family protein [Paracoccus sphaerophysae]
MTGLACSRAEDAIRRAEALTPTQRRAIFTQFDPACIRAQADALDARALAGEEMPLYGLTVSIKDLFDEEDQVTSAGSRLLAGAAPAKADSAPVARLKAAGALCVGRTSMSEFAYSGVGLNPHHGTPESSLGGGMMPGGSTSGGAVAVGLGITDAALGSDTGGSCRIPAAANRLWGFKPTQAAVPDQGTHPLAPSYDTVGVIARDLDQIGAFFQALSGTPVGDQIAEGPLTLTVPQGAFTNDLAAETAAFFDNATAALHRAGHRLVDVDLGDLNEALWVNRFIVAHEALGRYRNYLERLEEVGDPRVLARIRFALTLSEDDIACAYDTRKAMVARYASALEGMDALICPTLPEPPPTIAEIEADFDRLNARMLRNPSLINLGDGCALAMPAGTEAQSLMIAAPAGADVRLLDVARRLARDGIVR